MMKLSNKTLSKFMESFVQQNPEALERLDIDFERFEEAFELAINHTKDQFEESPLEEEVYDEVSTSVMLDIVTGEPSIEDEIIEYADSFCQALKELLYCSDETAPHKQSICNDALMIFHYMLDYLHNFVLNFKAISLDVTHFENGEDEVGEEG